MTDGAATVEELDAMTRACTPIHGGLHELAAVPRDADGERVLWIDPQGRTRVTLRLITWDRPRGDDSRAVVEFREQEVLIAPGDLRDEEPERARAYLLGWADAVGVCLERMREGSWLMPADLVFPRVVELTRPRTREQFARALLVRSRLGRWMSEET